MLTSVVLFILKTSINHCVQKHDYEFHGNQETYENNQIPIEKEK